MEVERIIEAVDPHIKIGNYTVGYLLSIRDKYEEIQKVLPNLESLLEDLMKNKNIKYMNDSMRNIINRIKEIQHSKSGGS